MLLVPGICSVVGIYSTVDMITEAAAQQLSALMAPTPLLVARICSTADRRRQAYSDLFAFCKCSIGVTIDRGHNLTLMDIRRTSGGSEACGSERKRTDTGGARPPRAMLPGPLGPGAAPIN